MHCLTIHFIILALLALLPVSTESLRFWQIRSAIEIKVQKNTPPYQAFKLVHPHIKTAEQKITNVGSVEKLSTETSTASAIQSYQKIVLLEPLVVKKIQRVDIQKDFYEAVDTSWISSLPLRQRVRLEEAQARFSIFNDAEEAKRNLLEEHQEKSPIEVLQTPSGYTIRGPLEISGGLALTNEHFIELRRSVEGTPREAGKVSAKDGTYNIHVDALAGSLIAKMYTKSGRILGEGFLRLAQDVVGTGVAPKLVIRPQVPWSGAAYDTYSSPGKLRTPAETQVTAWNRETDFESKDGQFQMAGVSPDSTTVVRAEAKNFLVTNSIQIASSDFKAPLFPKSMIKALKEIVSEQLSYDLNDPNLPVIWGQVLLNGKPMANAQVEVEGYEGIRAVYFEGLMPDVQLKETTNNGYFAIIGAPEGLHALIAKRGDQYFAHNIVVVEEGTVSLTQLESTLKTKNVPLRAFDAFSGAPKPADIEMQSLENPLHLTGDGWTTVLLPEISRYSLMQVTPDGDYLPAQYFYKDNQEYIHVPLVQERWLMSILQPKWSQIDSNKGTVIGFFNHESFEVFLAGEENFSQENITFFDSQGNQVFEGVPGGGFIVNNIDLGTHEIVVFGKESEKIYSRLLPVDARSVSVLTFQEY